MGKIFSVFAGLGLVAISAAQSPGQAVEYAVTEGMIQVLRSDGILIGYPDVFFRTQYRRPSPWENAVAANAAFCQLEAQSRNLPGLLKAPGFFPSGSKEAASSISNIETHRQKFVVYRQDVAIVQRLFGIYASYMTQLGVDVPASQQILKRRDGQMLAFIKGEAAKPGEALEPFIDVKPQHWAAQATTKLRGEGILTGYPDGRFGG